MIIIRIFALLKVIDIKDMEMDIVNLISNVGFPMAMCVILIVYVQKLNKRHNEEITALKDSLHKNTNVLVELSTLIKMMLKNEKENTL